MALTTDGMKGIIQAAFQGMVSTGQDSLFANGIANGCVAAVGTAQVKTEANAQVGTDAGPAGAFTGTAQGTMVVVPATCMATILAACSAMSDGSKDDDYLAEQIASAIDDMCAAATFVITISGQTVTTTVPPQTVSSSDSGKGTFSGDPSGIESDLKDVFARMKDVDSEGNASATDTDLIDTLCSSFEDYLKNAQVSIQGMTHLSGTSGMGSIS